MNFEIFIDIWSGKDKPRSISENETSFIEWPTAYQTVGSIEFKAPREARSELLISKREEKVKP